MPIHNMVGGGNGQGGIIKVFTGFTIPVGAVEGDIWVKTDKPIDNIIFDDEFNLNKPYKPNSLIIKYSSNFSAEPGLRYRVNIMNRSKNFNVSMPLYVSVYMNDKGVWEYPYTDCYTLGVWNYFCGIDKTINDNFFIGSYDRYSNDYQVIPCIWEFSLNGLQLKNKISGFEDPTAYYPLIPFTTLTHPIQNKIYMGLYSNSTSDTCKLFIVDRNSMSDKPTIIDLSNGSYTRAGSYGFNDDKYWYVVKKGSSYSSTIYKISLIPPYNIISSNSLSRVLNNNLLYQSEIGQNSRYVFMGPVVVDKTTLERLTSTSNLSPFTYDEYMPHMTQVVGNKLYIIRYNTERTLYEYSISENMTQLPAANWGQTLVSTQFGTLNNVYSATINKYKELFVWGHWKNSQGVSTLAYVIFYFDSNTNKFVDKQMSAVLLNANGIKSPIFSDLDGNFVISTGSIQINIYKINRNGVITNIVENAAYTNNTMIQDPCWINSIPSLYE